MSFAEEKKIYGICKKQNCSEEKARAICQVINSYGRKEKREKQRLRDSGIIIVNFSSLPNAGSHSSYECFWSSDPMPEEVIIHKEDIAYLLKMIESLPEKYRSFVTTAIEHDCVGVFEEPKEEKYGEVQKLAKILGVHVRTIRRYVKKTTGILYEMGKERFVK